jgi:hypothetical protein
MGKNALVVHFPSEFLKPFNLKLIRLEVIKIVIRKLGNVTIYLLRLVTNLLQNVKLSFSLAD